MTYHRTDGRETQFLIVPWETYQAALREIASFAFHGSFIVARELGDPEPSTFRCSKCGRSIWWQDCPTGGWWVHDVHFPDDHDAECGGIGTDDNGTG